MVFLCFKPKTKRPIKNSASYHNEKPRNSKTERERERENSLPATPAASLQITRTVDETKRIIKKPSTPTLSMQSTSSNQTKAPNHKNPNLLSQSRSQPTFQIPSPSLWEARVLSISTTMSVSVSYKTWFFVNIM